MKLLQFDTAAIQELYVWAKMAAEETRAQVGDDQDPDTLVPSWLPELEAAIKAVEGSPIGDICPHCYRSYTDHHTSCNKCEGLKK